MNLDRMMPMKGAILGDVVGSTFEHAPTKSADFPLLTKRSRFTDDTVMTVATASALLTDGDFASAYRAWGGRYPHAGYGGAFRVWLGNPAAGPYGSWGNGSAMRVGPVGWMAQTEDECVELARRSASVSHDHPRGIAGAQAVALAIWLARHGAGKATIREQLARRFGYDLERTVTGLRPAYRFDVSCDGSVPEAIIAFLDSESVVSAIRLAVSLGGDADTQAAIAGGIAEAQYGGVPTSIWTRVRRRLTPDLLEVLKTFEGKIDSH